MDPRIPRRKTRPVRIGGVTVGGDAPIRVQSMTQTDTRDVKATVQQIRDLALAGCELVRVAVPDMEAAQSLGRIKEQIDLPLIADIHFDYRLALEALRQGVDKIRLNPGNIGGDDRVRAVAQAAQARGVPIRVGANMGSLNKQAAAQYGDHTPEALVASALQEVRLLEEVGFEDIVVATKCSDVRTMIESYRMIADQCDYPLHLGVTEAGPPGVGSLRSAVGIGTLLAEGIGDTIRVSLSGPREHEMEACYEILKALGLRERGPTLISCPSCGRCEIDLTGIATEVQARLRNLRTPLKVAVMGCAVNGPGEARSADVGIAGGRGEALLFRRGEVVRKFKEENLVEVLMQEIEALTGEKVTG